MPPKMDSEHHSSSPPGRHTTDNPTKLPAANLQGPPIAIRRHPGLKVQYSMANFEFSMHESMSGDSFFHSNRNDVDSTTDDDARTQPTHPRVFVHRVDNIEEALNENDNMQIDPSQPNMMPIHPPFAINPNFTNNTQPSAEKDSAPRNVLADIASSASNPDMPVKRPISHRPRGVDLSSSSSEEFDDDNDDNGDNDGKDDNVNVNVNVNLNANAAQEQPHRESHARVPLNRFESLRVGGKLVDDSQYDELEAEEEAKYCNKYKNQFMRIPVPASELKDVATVKKDINHDKPKLQRRPSLIKGLQRAMSGAKTSDNNERQRPAVATKTQPGKSGMQRTASKKGGLYRKGEVGGATYLEPSAKPTNNQEPVVKNKENTSAGKRQSIANLGRMKSMDRRSPVGVDASADGVGVDAASGTANPGYSEGKNDSSSAVSQISISQESLPRVRHREDEVVLDGGTGGPVSDRSMNSFSDRPRNSDRVAGTGGRGRTSIGNMGRIMSRDRRKSVANIRDVSHQGTERVGPRSSLSRIGRALSFNRGKTAAQLKHQQQTLQQQQNQDGQNAAGADGKQMSPMSTSTVSAASVTGSPIADRERDRPGDGAARRESRLSMRGVGRMFSLTRRSGVGSGVGGAGNGGGGDQRASGFIGGRQSRQIGVVGAKSTGNLKKTGGDAGAGRVAPGGSSKADKFVYSEITSTAVIQSGLIGNGKHIRVAQIAMAEYSQPLSRDKWFIDVFTLAHNAVRRECIDLYDMLTALARCDGTERDVCDDDISALQRWWVVAHALLRCYFDMERGILFPWVDSAGAKEWEVQLALKKMRSLKDKLETLLSKVDRVWNEKTFKSAGEMYAMFYKAVDDFVPRLVNYFSDQEMLLPAIVREFYRKEHAMEIDKQIVATFLNSSAALTDPSVSIHGAKYNLVALIRWIPKSKQLRAWLGKYLTSSERAMYPSWYQMYEENHTSIVTHLRSRAAAI